MQSPVCAAEGGMEKHLKGHENKLEMKEKLEGCRENH